MNWERVYMVYYIYTSISVVFLLLSLGKFFCVRKLYEVYDSINNFMNGTLTGCVIANIFLMSFAYIALYFQWKVFILLLLFAMVLGSFIVVLSGVIAFIVNAINFMKEYHIKLKHKKNI